MFAAKWGINRQIRAGILVCAVVGSALLTGCGGGSSSGSEGTTISDKPTITKSGLIKKGDAICREIDVIQNKKFEKYVEEHQKAPDDLATQEQEVIVAGLPPIRVEINRIAALGAPKGDEAEVEALIASLERALKKVEEKPSLVIGKTHTPFGVPDKLAKEYGFKDCVEAL